MTDGTRARLRAALPLLVLAGLPLVLLAFNDEWSWDSTSYFDNHVYVGFFLHYLEFNYPFVENYKSSRLPFVLPGVLLYRWLPAALAHHALFLLFLVGGAWLLYVWARPRFGTHAAFAVAAAQTVFTYSHAGPSYHNNASSAYFLAALVLLDAPARLSSRLRVLLAGGAFALALTTNSTVAGLTPVFGAYAFVALPRPRTPARCAGHALAALAGAVLALAGLGAINVALGGPFLFFVEQLVYSLSVAEKRELSRFTLLHFLMVWRFPLLTLPLLAALASGLVLARAVARRRFDPAALAGASLLASLGVAAVMQLRGLGMLEQPHVFHPFFVPTFMALAGILAPRPATPDPRAAASLEPWFLLASACLLVFPLSAFGAWFSMTLAFAAGRWPELGNGALPAYAILAAAVAAAACVRRSAPATALVAIGAFGIVNAVNTPVSQPAHLYDVGRPCSFRRDFFTALIEADPIFSEFDPDNQAWWLVPVVRFDQPKFDGRGWCSELPVDTVPRDILLTHYFYTTRQFSNGYGMPTPIRKVVVAGLNGAQIRRTLRRFEASMPDHLRYTQAFSVTISRPTFSFSVQGYDVSREQR